MTSICVIFSPIIFIELIRLAKYILKHVFRINKLKQLKELEMEHALLDEKQVLF